MTDTTCLRCGYELVQPDPGARCPECGRPQAASLGEFTLDAVRPSWLGQVYAGLVMVIISLIVLDLSMVSVLLATRIGVDLLGGTSPIAYDLFIAGIFGICAGYILLGAGWLVGTRPMPYGSVRWRSRRLTRLGALMGVGSYLMLMLSGMIGMGGMLPRPAGTLCVAAFLIGQVMMLISSGIYQMNLGARMPNMTVRRFAKLAAIATIAQIALILVLMGSESIIRAAMRRDTDAIIGFVMIVSLMLFITMHLMSAWLCARGIRHSMLASRRLDEQVLRHASDRTPATTPPLDPPTTSFTTDETPDRDVRDMDRMDDVPRTS